MEKKLADYIGVPALLEQTAEECNELSFATLKLARMMRGENKVHGRTEEELKKKVLEECADILICTYELESCGLIKHSDLFKMIEYKVERMNNRLAAEDAKKKRCTTTDGSDPMDILMDCLSKAITEIILGPAPKKKDKEDEVK